MSQNGPVIRRSSPQIAQVSSISSTMLDVIVALLPALGMAVYLFGPRVLALTLVSVAACVGAEYGYRRLMGLSNTVGDLSACVTGLLLAMSLPVTRPTGPRCWAASFPLWWSSSFTADWGGTL